MQNQNYTMDITYIFHIENNEGRTNTLLYTLQEE